MDRAGKQDGKRNTETDRERKRERETEMCPEVGRKLAAGILRFMVTGGSDAGCIICGLTRYGRTLTVRQTGGKIINAIIDLPELCKHSILRPVTVK
jgi:hypothetical protein